MTYWYMLGIAAVLAAGASLGWQHSDNHRMGETARMLTVFGGIVCLMGTLLSGLGFIAANLERTECLEHGTQTRLTVQYQLVSGCYVKVDGRFIPYDRWVRVSGTNAP